MVQNCQVFFNLLCEDEDRLKISQWLKDYFSEAKHHNIYHNPISRIEICDEELGMIEIEIETDIQCYYIGGTKGSRWEPPEPAYIDGYFDDTDFKWWMEDILAASPYKNIVDIEIDDDSFIPSEDFLIREFEDQAAEDYYNAKY